MTSDDYRWLAKLFKSFLVPSFSKPFKTFASPSTNQNLIPYVVGGHNLKTHDDVYKFLLNRDEFFFIASLKIHFSLFFFFFPKNFHFFFAKNKSKVNFRVSKTKANWFRMAGFAAQAALRTHYEDLIDETEHDITEKLSSAVSWFKQVLWFFIRPNITSLVRTFSPHSKKKLIRNEIFLHLLLLTRCNR